MIVETGRVNSFKDLGIAFLDFAQRSNANTVAWELVDDRIDTFYGATLKFPVNDSNDPHTKAYAYISLQYNKITKTTYSDWLHNSDDRYMSETFDGRLQVRISDNNVRQYNFSSLHTDSNASIFADTGEVLFISPHVKYDKNLWMCEQGGIACDQESRTQVIDNNALKNMKRYSGSNSIQLITMPPFPGLGCPMFTISDEQILNAIDDDSLIGYYFVRDDHSASIVVYVFNPASDSSRTWLVQHMSFGVLDSFSITEQFLYPLYVAGGNGALYPEAWSFTYPGASRPTYIVGNTYKLDMSSIALSNCNLLLSCKFNGSNISNFRVLCPDGYWDNIFNSEQTATLITKFSCYPTGYEPRYYVFQKPVIGGSEMGDARHGGTTTLNGSNSIKRIDSEYINVPKYKTPPSVTSAAVGNTTTSPLFPVMPCFSSHKTVSGEQHIRHRYGVIGCIPRCFYTWSRDYKFGEIRVNGKLYLAIPQAYDDRYWYPKYYNGGDNLATYIEDEHKKYTAHLTLNNEFMYEYLLLALEE